MRNRLTDGDLAMIATAVRNTVDFWTNTPADAFQAEQLKSWQALLDKVEDLEDSDEQPSSPAGARR